MPITITHPVNILVIGKDPEILKVVLRLLNDHQPAHYHAVGSTDPDQARSLFADTDSAKLPKRSRNKKAPPSRGPDF